MTSEEIVDYLWDDLLDHYEDRGKLRHEDLRKIAKRAGIGFRNSRGAEIRAEFFDRLEEENEKAKKSLAHRAVSKRSRRSKPAGTPPKVKENIKISAKGEDLELIAKGNSLVKNLEDLVVESGVDTNLWKCTHHTVNTWTTSMRGTKHRDGSEDPPKIVSNWQVRANFSPKIELQDLQAKVQRRYPRRKIVGPVGSILVVPDSQHGFKWSGQNRRELIPLHDEAACALVPVIARKMRPEVIVLLGDHLDFPDWSTRYPRPEELRGTTQMTLQAVHDWIAEIRASAPRARIVYIEGNHEERVRRGLIEQNSPAQSVRAVGDSDEALSVARLLALRQLGVEYVGPYGTDFWLDDVRFAHGTVVRQKGGATATAVLQAATSTTWYGHVHRAEFAQRTIHDAYGPRVITAASPGCLSRIDGTVPGATKRPDWQQGLGFMWLENGDEWAEVRPIVNGTIQWDGRLLSA